MSFNRLGSRCLKESKAGWGGTIVDHHQVGNSLEELNLLDWPAVNPEDKCTLGRGREQDGAPRSASGSLLPGTLGLFSHNSMVIQTFKAALLTSLHVNVH